MVTFPRLSARHVADWYTAEARDLIQNILRVDPAQRLTIAQILAHPWFAIQNAIPPQPLATTSSIPSVSRSASPTLVSAPSLLAAQPVSSSSDASDATFHSASSEFSPSTPITPDDSGADISSEDRHGVLSRNASDSTLKLAIATHFEKQSPMSSVQEETAEGDDAVHTTPARPPLSRTTTGASHVSGSSKNPPALPTRTPVRTKRRSVSSTLSEPSSPTAEKPTSPAPQPDFSSLLSTPAPLIFSTPLERELLNTLSALGFDTGQIVHSVLTDACDATGSLWWMLKRKAERRAVQDAATKPATETKEEVRLPKVESVRTSDEQAGKSRSLGRGTHEGRSRSPLPPALVAAHSAPELQLIPATPTGPSHQHASTPPRAMSPSNPLLSPGSSTPAELPNRSHPSTPSGSMKESGSKGRGKRSGSVSIMQRAATALEAAGLVRKRSAEAVKDAEKDEKRNGSGDDPRTSHASSSKILRSPPLKPVKDEPGTPPRSLDSNPTAATVGSPWVLANARQSPPPTPANSPGNSLGSLPTIGENTVKISNNRNRASLLSTFRMWFKEDPKGKRKEAPPPLAPQSLAYPPPSGSPGTSPATGRGRGTIKRRISNGRPNVTSGRKTGNRAKRGSVSSRRSSSVNSKRSSATSAHLAAFEPSSYGEQMAPVSRQRSDPSRRSFGSHTPNSESRPSSVHSFSMQTRHRKSPSASSAGSLYMGRTSSPLPRFHRRAGSGSSTRVVRHMSSTVSYKQSHLRSNSASSIHSMASSRHGSLQELSETERLGTDSPTRFITRNSLDDTPRRSPHPYGPTTFVAQKRQTPFSNPSGGGYLHSFGRSSWKRSWGLEPPGWQTRTAKASTIEVLAISPPPGGIRDVFTTRQSLSMGDEDDWVDEDDDVPAGYVGGLGQMPASSSSGGFAQSLDSPMSPPLRGHRSGSSSSKRAGGSGNAASTSTSRSGRKSGRSPAGRSSPVPTESFEAPPETRGGRRQLPTSRSGPAFKHAIQEEDEDEE